MTRLARPKQPADGRGFHPPLPWSLRENSGQCPKMRQHWTINNAWGGDKGWRNHIIEVAAQQQLAEDTGEALRLSAQRQWVKNEEPTHRAATPRSKAKQIGRDPDTLIDPNIHDPKGLVDRWGTAGSEGGQRGGRRLRFVIIIIIGNLQPKPPSRNKVRSPLVSLPVIGKKCLFFGGGAPPSLVSKIWLLIFQSACRLHYLSRVTIIS
jgi:hypothetical protein